MKVEVNGQEIATTDTGFLQISYRQSMARYRTERY